MDEIRIEKKRSAVMPWIVGILLLAVVLFVVVRSITRTDSAAAPAQQTTESGPGSAVPL